MKMSGAPILTRAEALRLASQFGPISMDAAGVRHQEPASIKYFNGAGEELTLAEFIESD